MRCTGHSTLRRPLGGAGTSVGFAASVAVVVAGSLATTLGAARSVHAGGSETLKVGVIGCGGRGSVPL